MEIILRCFRHALPAAVFTLVFRRGIGAVVGPIVTEAVGEVIIASQVGDFLRASSAGIVHGIDVAQEIAHTIRGTASAAATATAATATARIIAPQKSVHR